MKKLRTLCLPMLLMAATAAWAGTGLDTRNASRCPWQTPAPAANDPCHHGNDPLVPWTYFPSASTEGTATQANTSDNGHTANDLARTISLPIHAMANYAGTLLSFLARLCADAVFGVSGS